MKKDWQIIKNNVKYFQKEGGRKIKEKTAQQWIPIDYFEDDGFIKLKNGNIIKILKVEPINYNLKSDLEKKSILNSYKVFLKTCNFDIQIIIQSNKQDLSEHIKQIEKNIQRKENKNIRNLGKGYIKYIKQINSSKRNSSKIFYLILSDNLKKIENTNNAKEIIKNELKEKYFKVKECLSRCGNSVIEVVEKNELIEIIDSFFNTRKYLNMN